MHEGRDTPEDSSESCRSRNSSTSCTYVRGRSTSGQATYHGTVKRTVLQVWSRSEANPPGIKEYEEYAKRGSLHRRSNPRTSNRAACSVLSNKLLSLSLSLSLARSLARVCLFLFRTFLSGGNSSELLLLSYCCCTPWAYVPRERACESGWAAVDNFLSCGRPVFCCKCVVWSGGRGGGGRGGGGMSETSLGSTFRWLFRVQRRGPREGSGDRIWICERCSSTETTIVTHCPCLICAIC